MTMADLGLSFNQNNELQLNTGTLSTRADAESRRRDRAAVGADHDVVEPAQRGQHGHARRNRSRST